MKKVLRSILMIIQIVFFISIIFLYSYNYINIYFFCFLTIFLFIIILINILIWYFDAKYNLLLKIAKTTKNSCIIFNSKSKKIYYMDIYFKNVLSPIKKKFKYRDIICNNYLILDNIVSDYIYITGNDYIFKYRKILNYDVCYVKKNLKDLEILSKVSHEIRTPLITLNNISKENSENKSNLIENIEVIKDTSKYLLNITDNILNTTNQAKNNLELNNQYFCLYSFVEVLKSIVFNIVKKKKINFIVNNNVNEKEFVYSDKDKLMQILINLINNSYKFSNDETNIILTIDKTKYNTYSFKIIDEGIGMSKEFIDKMFKPYTQEKRNYKKNPGVGLGLNIVKQYVDALSGDINVSSEINEGTTFELIFDMLSLYDNKNIKNLSKKKVLIIDDDLINTQICKQHFLDLKINVRSSNDGRKAIELIQNNDCFDIILLDLTLPSIDGYLVCDLILNNQVYKNYKFKIILMSASIINDKINKLLENQNVSFISKPIEKEKLYNLIY